MPAEPTPTTLTAEPGSNGQHFSLDVKFPVYSIGFVGEQQVVLAGGGGSSRTGVKNRLVSILISSTVFRGKRKGRRCGEAGRRTRKKDEDREKVERVFEQYSRLAIDLI